MQEFKNIVVKLEFECNGTKHTMANTEGLLAGSPKNLADHARSMMEDLAEDIEEFGEETFLKKE